MFTKKLTEWTQKDDTSESDIEDFFSKNKFIFSFYEKNTFNGFLIDYEFLLLKKNFVKNLQKDDTKKELNINSKKNVMMKGMMTSTIFALDASNIKQVRPPPIEEKKIIIHLDKSHHNPLIFDFILEYACK
jgi:hypothetical protein